MEYDLESKKEIIFSEDFSFVKKRLEGDGKWNVYEIENGVTQYRRYLWLRLKHSDIELPPSLDIDEAWRAHISHIK